MENSLYLKNLGDRSGLDLCDLIHGEGEWKNMQDVIRRSFLLSFDQIQRQQEQISKLVDVVTNLRSQLSKKPCRDDITTMIDTSISNMKSHRYAKATEIDEMKTKILDFQADLERKASIRYVDDSLKRKLDKTDNSLRVLSSFSGTQFNSEMTKFASELGDFRARTEILGINVNEIGHELRCTAKEIDVRGMQAQIEDLFAMVSECPTKSQLNPIMSNKVDLSELDSLLLKKMDKSHFDANLSRLEQAILEQDKIVTSIRVRFNDESMFSIPSTSKKIHNNNDNSSKTSNIHHSKVNAEDLVKPENDHINIIPIIQEGRMEVVISSMWQKIINLQNECQDNRGLIKNLDELLLRTDAINKSSANLKQVETLAVILEEQKQRTDLIICGALTIAPINEALESICKEMDGIQKYLGLPQNQPLTQQLTEAGDLVDSLANRIGDFGTALGRAGIRIESSEKILSQLDNRINLVESNSSDNKFFKTQIQGEINATKNFSTKINELESIIFKIQQDQKNILENHNSNDSIHKNRIESIESSISKLQVVKKQFDFNSTQFDNLQDLTDFIERLSISISDIKSYLKIEKKQNKLNNSNNSNNYKDEIRPSIDIDIQNRSSESRISENNYISKKVNTSKHYSDSNLDLDSVHEPLSNIYMKYNTNFVEHNNRENSFSSVDHVDERLKILQNEKDRLRKKLEKHEIVGL